jgi:hypothetical protein
MAEAVPMNIAALNQWLAQNFFYVELGTVLLLLGALAVFWRAARRLNRYHYLLSSDGAADFEENLIKMAENLKQAQRRLTNLENQYTANLLLEAKHLQYWSLVRFKAFENSGSDQSFALALLDAAGDGVVVSSIFGREEARTYCKLIQRGKSTYPLSDEEKQAIAQALGKE